MQIIPVLDIKGGVVVQAERGQREKYKPIKDSYVSASCNPSEVVEAFLQKLELQNLYVADLDSIEGTGNNFEVLKRLKETYKIEIMSDIGIRNSSDLNNEIVPFIDRLILGTETLVSLEAIEYVLKIKGVDNMAISMDFKNGQFISNCNLCSQPLKMIDTIYQMGVRNFIFLDLKNIIEPIIKNIVNKRSLKIFIGGGIRTVKDIIKLERIGVTGVLIGTAFHKGFINKNDLTLFDKDFKIESLDNRC
jgi:phosphoribosylformimino-5-aminoimidazole carboxamide ribotide isomerase